MADETPRYPITFLRHGESTGNAEDRHQGQSDFPLSPLGKAQAHALASQWRTAGVTFDRIITSTLSRALQTAEILAAELELSIEPDPLWMERHNGQLAGLQYDEARVLYRQPAFTIPYESYAETGEGDWALYLRVGQALHQLMQRPVGNYLVISHGGFLNQVMYAVTGITPQPNFRGPRFRFDNTGFADTSYDPATYTWRILSLNDLAHADGVGFEEITDVESG
jgi:2,3-bisphosphoglycerate-dependent phosphoglycerate mutase